ncbi:YidC/Oxa1 family membrane protein insertase [Polycladomyces subterraneus]|uniref:YidC/Oxa1 family membrane protein insertase n=1 Tax=Polycladomyces subterraneus TaxID=1016997 RepID=UPI003F4E14E9
MQGRRILTMILIAAMVLTVAGCAPSTTAKQHHIDPSKSLWDRFFLYPLTVLMDSVKGVLGNYGWAILVLTVLIRLLILPLTIKQMKSSQAMQKLQPEINRLREKYKDNPQKMQEETVKLFQKHNVNPMAGCMPLLIQLPILIAFYQSIMYNTHIRNSDFLWMHLGSADPYYVLPVLAGVTTYLQSILMGMGNNPQARVFLFVMPVMIFVLALSFPSALALYWVYSNLFTMVQYYFIGDKYKVKREGAAR